jgi:hypothetical protein
MYNWSKDKKVLYVGVKNKFCKICKIYEKSNEKTPSHMCYKNWNETSTSMELFYMVLKNL